jgi:hypothetical protein
LEHRYRASELLDLFPGSVVIERMFVPSQVCVKSSPFGGQALGS